MNLKNHNSYFTYQTGHGYARTGVLKTRAGEVHTPTFMPDATRGAVKGLTPEAVAGTGVQVVLNNTYHLHLQPGEAVIKSLSGVHEFGKWRGPILTDSGGFQVFSLDKFTKVTEDGVRFKDPINGDMRNITPEKSMQIQFELGSDMFVAFDHLIGLDNASDADVNDAFERTHRWLDRCIVEFKRLTKGLEADKRPLLFGVVQGGLDKDLRRRSLELVMASEVDGIAIGGLSVGEPRDDMHDMLKYLAPLYDDDPRPRFLLGVGDPIDLRMAIECGIDMLDCVLPTRNARHATVWVAGDKKIHLTNAKYIDDLEPIDPGCDCYTCSANYSKGFLRHLFKSGDPLGGSLASIHNLRYLTAICEGYLSSNLGSRGK
jgi:queuine tRNA-ribosyltransferase